jgi:hypothetical protein
MSAEDQEAFKARLLQLAEEEASKSAQPTAPAPVDGEASAPAAPIVFSPA